MPFLPWVFISILGTQYSDSSCKCLTFKCNHSKQWLVPLKSLISQWNSPSEMRRLLRQNDFCHENETPCGRGIEVICKVGCFSHKIVTFQRHNRLLFWTIKSWAVRFYLNWSAAFGEETISYFKVFFSLFLHKKPLCLCMIRRSMLMKPSFWCDVYLRNTYLTSF